MKLLCSFIFCICRLHSKIIGFYKQEKYPDLPDQISKNRVVYLSIIMAGSKESHVIQLAAVGRPFKLGMLYDCRTETLVPGITLWDKTILEQNIVRQPQATSDFKIIASDTIKNKANALDVNANLKLSFLGGLIQVSGSAKYLDDRTSSSHQERVTLNYKCTTRFESLTMAQLGKGNFQHPDIFSAGDATHVVTGIMYGGQAFLLFDKQHSDSDSKRNVEGSVTALIKAIPTFQIEGRADVQLSEKQKEQADSLNVQFYGDFIPPTSPTTYAEAVQLYKTLPDLLGKSGEGAVPLTVWLYPLCNLDSKACKLVREISTNLVNETEKVFEQLHQHETKCNDLLKTPACQNFSGLHSEILRFREIINEYKIEFQKQLLPVLPKIRGGGMKEVELAKILKEKEKSPFSEQALLQWLQQKGAEAKVLNQYVQSMSSIQFAKAPGDLEAACMDPKNKYVVCFTIKRSAKHPYLLALKVYLQDSKVTANQEGTKSTSPFQAGENCGMSMITNARAFINYFQASKSITTTRFIIAEQQIDSGDAGGYICLYKDGKIADENFVPPTEPSMPLISDVRHDSVTLTWKKPQLGYKNVTGYEIIYRKTAGSETFSETTQNNESFVLSNLEPATYYSFQLRSCSLAGLSEISDTSKPHLTLPTSPPGKPKACATTSFVTAKLEWAKPIEIGREVTIDSYTVYDKSWTEIKQVLGDETRATLNIKPNTKYQFIVVAECGKLGKSMASKPSDIFLTEAEETDIRKFEIVSMSEELSTAGKLKIYRFPTNEVYVNASERIRKCEFGFGGHNIVKERVIMVVGATGAGKSTLINGVINFILGVKWKDEFRFKLIVETSPDKKADQAKSQTSWITSYTIHHEKAFTIPFTLTIIDTPGFGDTSGIDRDKEITKQIKCFFTTRGIGGIDHIDAVGFVVQSSLPRLTANQTYIFDSILSLFGKDIEDNIFMLLTFADGNKPPVLHGLDAAKMPYKKWFKFNNSALFSGSEGNTEDSDDDDDENFDEMFWKMGEKSFKKFICNYLDRVKPRSLTLTKDVLHEREQLEVYVQGIQFDIQKGLNKLEQLKKELQVVKNHEADIDKNKNFYYTVEEEKVVTTPIELNRYTTNCIACKRTCHFDCGIKDDGNKSGCIAMSNGKCTICPGHCIWNVHKNFPYIFEIVRETVKKPSAELKARYEDAKGKKLSAAQLIQEVLADFKNIQVKVIGLTERVRMSIQLLQEIALKPNPLSTTEYLDILIESEKAEAKPGWTERVEQLTGVRKQAEYMKQLADQGINPFEQYQEVLEEANKYEDIEEEGFINKFLNAVTNPKNWFKKHFGKAKAIKPKEEGTI